MALRRMDDRRRRILQSMSVMVRNDMLSVDDVITHLVAANIIPPSLQAELMVIQPERKRATELHMLIPKRGQHAFDHYYLAMMETGNYVLASCLENDLVDSSLKHSQPHMQATGQPIQETAAKTVIASPTEDDKPDVPEVWPDVNEYVLNVEVVKCDPNDVAMKKKFEDTEGVYPMKSKNARILIINNETFENAKDSDEQLGKREGTDIDATCIDSLFKKLGYHNIRTERDLTGAGILDTLKKEAAGLEKSAEGFICFILSHGKAACVYGSDGAPVLLEEIYNMFDGVQCKALAGKPKLFFIQACQGSKKDDARAVAVPEEPGIKSLDDQFKNLHVSHESTDSCVDVPTKADILVATATTPGYVSWRNKDYGTWFIQALVYMLKNHAHKYEILKILQLVNRMVSKNATQVGAYKQASEQRHTLRKDLYFFPGFGQERDLFSQLQ